VQWYENVPAFVKVLLKFAPGAIVPEFHDPSSPVDVCASASLFVHVIVSPAAIDIGFGAYAVFVKTDAFLTMDTGVPVTPDPPEGVDGEYELQPTVKAISPAIMPSRNVILFSIRWDIAKALPRRRVRGLSGSLNKPRLATLSLLPEFENISVDVTSPRTSEVNGMSLPGTRAEAARDPETMASRLSFKGLPCSRDRMPVELAASDLTCWNALRPLRNRVRSRRGRYGGGL
jgi:hypothetical protein